MVDKLLMHLRPVKEKFDLDIFQVNGINPGSTWDSQIMNAIAAADVFILCLSPAFLASQYTYYVELPAIRRRANEAGAIVVPVLLEACAWWGWMGDWQVSPMRGHKPVPVADWKSTDAGIRAAVSDIRHAIAVHLGLEQPTPIPTRPIPVPREALDALGPGKLSPSAIQAAVAADLASRKAASGA